MRCEDGGRERGMNRQKYMNDKSYREGYEDGRNDAINMIATSIIAGLMTIESNIEGLKKAINDFNKDIEGGEE